MRKRAVSPITLGVLVLLSAGCASRAGSLLTGLERVHYANFNDAFLARLAPTYAVGAPEEGLADLFIAEGMEVTREPVRVNESVLFGKAETSGGWCGNSILVIWRADASGRLTELRGVKRDANCVLAGF